MALVLGDAIALVLVGLAIGVPIAPATARATAVAVGAGYVPAMRAARTDPMIALRCE